METMDKRGEQKKLYAPKLPERKYGYFRDDQIMLLAAHKEEVMPEAELMNHANILNQSLKSIKPGAVVASHPRVDTFRLLPNPDNANGQEGMLSMLTYPVENAPENPNYLMTMVGNYNQQPKSSLVPGLRILGASPNWLTSVASNGSGTGGPGSIPVPYNGSIAGAHPFESLMTSLTQNNLYDKKGEGVDVAILDTAPSAQALVAASKEWRDHPIIKTLLGPQGKLKLYPAPYDEVVRLGNTSLNDHDYNMTDHGLFVAGIVHSIVPEARIHLIEVLNQYGIGDLMSFFRGLGIVRNELYNPERKLVINCSWMLEMPLDPLQCRHLDQTDPDSVFEQEVLKFSKNDRATAAMLEFLFNQFYTLGRQAIAAAGNDGRDRNTNEIPTRYPAALNSVAGVGAFPKTMPTTARGQYERSTYSNISDEPERRGIVTLGGEAGEGNGVLGVYIGEFPVELNPSLWQRFLNWLIVLLGGRVAGPANMSKWAWWAGTSFATPVLTGAVAAVLSSSISIARTQDAIQKLSDLGIIGGSRQPGAFQTVTPLGEEVMAVTQN
jgi:Subtilase family